MRVGAGNSGEAVSSRTAYLLSLARPLSSLAGGAHIAPFAHGAHPANHWPGDVSRVCAGSPDLSGPTKRRASQSFALPRAHRGDSRPGAARTARANQRAAGDPGTSGLSGAV